MTLGDSGSGAGRRILLVEDNRDLAYGLRNNLEIEGYAVRVAEDGETALEALAAEPHFDLLILDLMLPGLDGFRVLRQARQQGTSLPILILSARGEEADKVRGLRLGADDYVTKPFGLLELLARVEALLRRVGEPELVQPVRLGELEIDPTACTVLRAGEPVDLTPKELDLLLALLARQGEAVSRLDLMRRVWGYSAAVVSRTVDTHIAELRRKLEADPAHPRHLVTVRKVGYRLDP